MPMLRGQLQIHPELNEIRGPAGCERLEPQAMVVLELLAGTPARVWSRNDLLDRAWSGRIVSDATLSGVVSRLRRALATVGAADVRIETLSKRGYRLSILSQPGRAKSKNRSRLAMHLGVGAILLALLVAGLLHAFLPSPLNSLRGVRLDFDITLPDGERSQPVIWLEDGGEGRVALQGEHPLEIRVRPELTSEGLLKLRVETSGFSHWSGFEQVIGLGTESLYTLKSERAGTAYEIRFVASRADPNTLPQ